MFISLEGIDGSGKSTVATDLYDQLNRNYKVKKISFPSNNVSGIVVRKAIDSGLSDEYISKLLIDDFKQCMKDIKKDLDDGYIVIADRYIDSYKAYQGVMLGDKFVRESLKAIPNIIKPDVTFYLYIRPCYMHKFASRRKRKLDTIEDRGEKFMFDIQYKYAANKHDKFVTVDVSLLTPRKVLSQIMININNRLKAVRKK